MITRRVFLATAGAVSATGVASYLAKPQLRQLLLPKLDITYPVGILQDTEMHTIVALGEALAAPQAIPPADFFRDYVNMVTKSRPGFLREYQRAAALLNATSADLFGRDVRPQFAELSAPQRDKVLQAQLYHYPGNDRVAAKLEKLSATRDALALRMYVMAPMIEYYYRSPYGWAVVGYKSLPGRPPLDPRTYTKSGVVS